jgi:hypothetical protein
MLFFGFAARCKLRDRSRAPCRRRIHRSLRKKPAKPGYQTSCQHKEFISTAQAPMLRVPFADGMASPDVPSDDLIPPSLWRPPTSWAPAGSPTTRPT